jgi:voltage-gated potassium channel
MRTYLRALSHLMRLSVAAWRDPRMQVLMTLGLCVLGTGTVVFHFAEGWSWLDSAYFSTVTLATVGFGDLHPVTVVGKLFVMAYILVGVGIFVAIFAFLSTLDNETLNGGAQRGDDKTDPQDERRR